MTHKLLFIAIIVSCSFFTIGQNDTLRKNLLYLEAGGPGGLGSLIYSRDLTPTKNVHLHANLGFSSLRFKDFRGKLNPDLVFISTLSLDFSGDKIPKWPKGIGLEFFIGNTMSNVVVAESINSFDRINSMNGVFGFYYRYNFPNQLFKVRIGYTPIFEEYNYYRHWYALSFGYRF